MATGRIPHLQDNGIDPAQHHLVCAPVSGSHEPVTFLVGQAATCYGQAIVATSAAREDGLKPEAMPGLPLTEILDPYPRIDLIDLDIQGAELEVLGAAMELLDARVKRLQIGTHFPCGSKIFVPKLGRELDVGDGVQTWINRRLE